MLVEQADSLIISDQRARVKIDRFVVASDDSFLILAESEFFTINSNGLARNASWTLSFVDEFSGATVAVSQSLVRFGQRDFADRHAQRHSCRFTGQIRARLCFVNDDDIV